MDVLQQDRKGVNLVSAYGARGFRVGENWHAHPLIISVATLEAWTSAASADALTVASFAFLEWIEQRPEILIFGSGPHFPMPDRRLMLDMKQAYGVSFDMMDTAAACRTYNVLVSEDRSVMAALLLPDQATRSVS